MFRNLLAIPEFVEEFTDKYAIYLGDFLHSERIIKQMDEMYEAIQHEYPFHYNKNLEDWGVDYSYFQNHAYYWIRGRYDFLYEHLANKFNLPEPAPININTLSQDISSISFNGIKLSANSFNGQYFAGKNITLSANIENPEYSPLWNIVTTNADGTQNTSEQTGSSITIQTPVNGKIDLSISSVMSGIDDVISSDSFDESMPYQIFNIEGIIVSNNDITTIPQGVYIIKLHIPEHSRSLSKVIS